MCYFTHIALSKMVDPPPHTELLRVSYVAPTPGPGPQELDRTWFTNQHIYYLGSKSGCSCTFRYWQHEIGMVPPQDWAHEDPGDPALLATRELFRWLRHLHEDGIDIELVVKWATEPLPRNEFIAINLDDITEETFLMFDDYKIKFPTNYVFTSPLR